ncbi:MAG TPA: prolipoprotein diacylglyceryl transferase [Bacteroidetes bacterium]|nr:prolipoprotein diacylglyceryl transferase [Bacteroidota bacterium]
MHPTIFQFGPIRLASYGLMVFLAFAFGVWLGMKRARKAGIDPGKVMDLTMWILVSSLVGARLAYVLFHLDEFQGRWLDVISPFQSDGTIGIAGLVILGGVILAVPVSYWYLKRHNIPFLKMADVMAPSLAFGIAIGRIGCFLNGCCFGLPTDLPWGVIFPENCYAGSVFPRQHIHPTQLYAIVFNSLLGVILLLRSPRRRFNGELFYLLFLLYGPYRMLIETIRYYRPSMVLFNTGGFHFTISMLISIMITIVAAVLLLRGYKSAGGGLDKG